jgi:hypothetical protein
MAHPECSYKLHPFSRPLPDMPTFLLSDLVNGFFGDRKTAKSENVVSESASSVLSSADLAAFCKSHNINSNLVGELRSRGFAFPSGPMASYAANRMFDFVHMPPALMLLP